MQVPSYITSLRFRIPLLIISSSLVMVGVSYFASAAYIKKETIEHVDSNLRNRLYFLQSAFEWLVRNDGFERSQSLISGMVSEPDLMVLLYADAEGTIRVSNTLSTRGENVFSQHTEIDDKYVSRIIGAKLIDSRLHSKGEYLDGMAPVCPKLLGADGNGCGFIYYKIDVKYHIANAENLLYLQAIIISIGMIMVGLAVVLLLYFWITKRFQILSVGLKEFASGKHTARIYVAGKDEIYKIAQGLNRLFSRVEEDELELKKRQEELDAVFNTVVDGIVIIDDKGIVYDCNPAVSKLFGYEKHEMLGHSVNMLMPEKYLEKHDQYIDNYLNSRISKIIGKGREVEAVRKGGGGFPIEIAVSEMLVDGNSMFAGVIRDVSEQKQLQATLIKTNELLFQSNLQLKNTANTDGLTGLANRRHFDHVLSEELNRSTRHNSELTLLMCDVDFFKNYNDSYGHQAGDDCLREIAGVLATSFKRSGELPARYGGEEFAVIIPGLSIDKARESAELLCRALSEQNIPHDTSSVAECVTVSIGMASLVHDVTVDARDFISYADEALYQAKELGRNQVVAYQKGDHKPEESTGNLT